MTYNLKCILILAVCFTVIIVTPAAADTLANYFNTGTPTGTFNQSIDYTGNGAVFTDGNLEFTFLSLTIQPVCMDGSNQVACATGSYHPVSAAALSVVGTSGINGFDGFDLTGQESVSSYAATNGDQIDVQEDITLNYAVSTMSGAATITDAHLDVGACVKDLAIQTTCLTSGGELPPNMEVSENWSANGVELSNNQLDVHAPPPVLDASTSFLPNAYSSLIATKDIMMETGACAGCSVSFSDLKQYYSQQVVPEPRTYAWLLALGMLGLVQLRRRSVVSA